MSKDTFEELDIPVDLEVDWTVGAVNSQRTKVYGICHDAPVSVGGITARCTFFVMENLSQDVGPVSLPPRGGPWELLVGVPDANRDRRTRRRLQVCLVPFSGSSWGVNT